MDLCLKGSQVGVLVPTGGFGLSLNPTVFVLQINLATRQKTKSKYTSRSLTTLHNPCPHFRPRSANYLHQRSRSSPFLQQRSRSSPFLARPQSADPKIGRRLSNYFSEKELRLSGKVRVWLTIRIIGFFNTPIHRDRFPRTICSSPCWRSPSSAVGCAGAPATPQSRTTRSTNAPLTAARRGSGSSNWNGSWSQCRAALTRVSRTDPIPCRVSAMEPSRSALPSPIFPEECPSASRTCTPTWIPVTATMTSRNPSVPVSQHQDL